MALLYLPVHVLPDFVHGHVARSFDECLHILRPCALYEFAHGVELGKLCRVVGIVCGAGPQTVAQRYGHVVTGTDVTDVVEVGIEKTLLLMHHAPL